MAYQVHNYQSGAKLYASQLNEMDEQIANNQQDIDGVKNKINADLGGTVNVTSPNLFDASSADLLHGYFSGSFIAGEAYRMSHPIHVYPGIEYKWNHDAAEMGANSNIPLVDENGQFTGAVASGTISGNYMTRTFGVECYIRVNIGSSRNVGKFMFCESSKYPSTYTPYGEITEDAHSKVNPLKNKKVVFDGDSICYGATDTDENGWGSRIGKNNSMDWHNVGVSGATIAVQSGRHNLCTYIDTIHANYPTLDYLILEGGTNDADIMGSAGKGTFEPYDFDGTYDTATFCGALETLFFKATSYYPKAKIGFIIAPKMAAPSGGKMVLPLARIAYFDLARETCKKWGVPYIDLWQCNPMNPCLAAYYNYSLTPTQNKEQGYAYSDGQHPTAAGYEIITPAIEAWMKTL